MHLRVTFVLKLALTVGKLLYNLFINLYPFAINLVSPFNEKAKLWLQGRRNVLERMQETIKPAENLIWMHCSSLGEFEQGRPVLEKLKSENGKLKV